MKLYAVTMYRWGDRECHSYLLGVYSDEQRAIDAGEAERQWRGGSKYYPECLEMAVDKGKDYRVVVELKRNPHFGGGYESNSKH